MRIKMDKSSNWFFGGGGSNIGQHLRDVAEVKACMAKPRDHVVTVFDVALECHLTDYHARNLMKEAMR